MKIIFSVAIFIGFVGLGVGQLMARSNSTEIKFPVEALPFVQGAFEKCEGLAFNGEGRLFAACDKTLQEVDTAGRVTHVADLFSNLGVAGIGERDLLVADFGPTNAFRNGRNSDGIVWRISPDGQKAEDATGIGDPNFILVRSDGTYLVSDDATSDIYVVAPGGEVDLYATAVPHPNGMVLSLDGKTLYVAQIFANIRPIVSDNALWAVRLADGKPARDGIVVARAGPNAAPDGLAMDKEGRVYIAANLSGKIWRYDPVSSSMTLIAENMFGAASIAFGEGDFDHHSLYVTTTFAAGRGGIIWRVPIDTTGTPVVR